MSVVPPEVDANGSAVADYDLAFQISPIILQGGIAAGAQGGLVPILSYIPYSRKPWWRFIPLPGSTLISQTVGMYPFANQAVAANATIQQPLTISLALISPVNQFGGYLQKLNTFSSLQQTLLRHNNAGGTYVVATSAFVYRDLLLTAMTDVTDPEEKQHQIQWQLDFIQPILTIQAAQSVYSGFIQKVKNGGQFHGPPSWSGNESNSPGTQTGITGALANVTAAISTFGGSL